MGKEHGCLVTTNCYNRSGTVTDLHAELILYTFSIRKHERRYCESNAMHLVVRMINDCLMYSLIFRLPNIHDHENQHLEWEHIPPTLERKFKHRRGLQDLYDGKKKCNCKNETCA